MYTPVYGRSLVHVEGCVCLGTVDLWYMWIDVSAWVLWAFGQACGQYLGGEVPVEDALAVEVLQASGDVQRQAHPHRPGQVHVAVQQLLQVPPVDVL